MKLSWKELLHIFSTEIYFRALCTCKSHRTWGWQYDAPLIQKKGRVWKTALSVRSTQHDTRIALIEIFSNINKSVLSNGNSSTKILLSTRVTRVDSLETWKVWVSISFISYKTVTFTTNHIFMKIRFLRQERGQGGHLLMVLFEYAHWQVGM